MLGLLYGIVTLMGILNVYWGLRMAFKKLIEKVYNDFDEESINESIYKKVYRGYFITLVVALVAFHYGHDIWGSIMIVELLLLILLRKHVLLFHSKIHEELKKF